MDDSARGSDPERPGVKTERDDADSGPRPQTSGGSSAVPMLPIKDEEREELPAASDPGIGRTPQEQPYGPVQSTKQVSEAGGVEITADGVASGSGEQFQNRGEDGRGSEVVPRPTNDQTGPSGSALRDAEPAGSQANEGTVDASAHDVPPQAPAPVGARQADVQGTYLEDPKTAREDGVSRSCGSREADASHQSVDASLDSSFTTLPASKLEAGAETEPPLAIGAEETAEQSLQTDSMEPSPDQSNENVGTPSAGSDADLLPERSEQASVLGQDSEPIFTLSASAKEQFEEGGSLVGVGKPASAKDSALEPVEATAAVEAAAGYPEQDVDKGNFQEGDEHARRSPDDNASGLNADSPASPGSADVPALSTDIFELTAPPDPRVNQPHEDQIWSGPEAREDELGSKNKQQLPLLLEENLHPERSAVAAPGALVYTEATVAAVVSGAQARATLQTDAVRRLSLAWPTIPLPKKKSLAERRPLLRRVGRMAALVAFAFAMTVCLLIILYRWINPPASTLMVGQRLLGTSIEQRWVPIQRISPHLIRAVVLSEDGAFCRHGGVDWAAMEEAIESARGGSTITMQVVKNLFLWPARSYVRKALEIVLAYVVEVVWPKKRILEVYLNIAEWGPGVFGAEAAARTHFGKRASQLSAHEAALLAVSLPNPIERQAGRPGWQTRRLANNLLIRMRSVRGPARCVAGAGR